MDPGASLFNPGFSLNLDLQNGTGLVGKEEEEDAEEIRRKEKELQALLRTEFDDLIDDNESSVESEESLRHDVNVHSQENHYVANQQNGPTYNVQPRWPFTKENETSTPKHPIPSWDMEYTPIGSYGARNNAVQSEVPRPGDAFFNTENFISPHALMNGHANRNPLQAHVTLRNNERNSIESPLPIDYAPVNGNAPDSPDSFLATNGNNAIEDQIGEDDQASFSNGLHHQYAQELINMKEKIVLLQEESSQNIRLLKHQLMLAKGERENLSFNLKQARQVLIDKEKSLNDVQMVNDQLKKELHEEKVRNSEFQQKLEVSQSLVESLKIQATELAKFETYSYMRDSKDTQIKDMESRHKEEINEYTRNLNYKDKDIERLSRQVEKLEKYQEQSMPNKLQAIEHLTRNLGAVEDYCQKLLVTDAFQTADQIRIQHDSKLDTSQNIQLLLNAISDLGTKLPSGSTVSLESHRNAISEHEKEKVDLEKELEIIKSELTDSMKKTARLSEENQKLRATMETMIKKHDLDIKSAIEKYHSLHSKETKILQEELGEAAEDEKNRMREFYEEKFSALYLETENLKVTLNEIKNLYVKVCEEKTILETELQTLKTTSLQGVSSEFVDNSKKVEEAEKIIDSRVHSEISQRWNAIEREWMDKKKSEMDKALEECHRDYYRKEELLKKKVLEREEDLSNLQKQFQAQTDTITAQNKIKKQLEQRIDELGKLDVRQELEQRIEELQKELESSRTILVQQQTELHSINERFSHEWTSRQDELQTVYRAKLEEIARAQKDELDKIMIDVEKAVSKEQANFMSQQTSVTKALQEKIKQLQTEVSFFRTPRDLKDASSNVALPSIKHQILIEQMKEKLNTYRLKEHQRTRNLRSSTSQTEEKLISKKCVIELNTMYKDVVMQMKGMLQVFYLGWAQFSTA